MCAKHKVTRSSQSFRNLDQFNVSETAGTEKKGCHALKQITGTNGNFRSINPYIKSYSSHMVMRLWFRKSVLQNPNVSQQTRDPTLDWYPDPGVENSIFKRMKYRLTRIYMYLLSFLVHSRIQGELVLYSYQACKQL